MKLPVVAIVGAFGCGIALALCLPPLNFSRSPIFLMIAFLTVSFLILAGIAAVKFGKLVVAAEACFVTWVLLGILGASIGLQPRPADHVVTLIEAQQIELKTPLRWHGRLRDEPAQLPWGYSYEIELARVDYSNQTLNVHGGLRLSYASRENAPAPLNLHAGDKVVVVAQAKRPQVYKDDGAFDRRAYLADQDIDLLATLRAPNLLESISAERLATHAAIARARQTLRDKIESLFSSVPKAASILRAMLLGDRSFIDRDEASDFQKTGVFHVLVVAGLHVGALATFLFWAGRRFRFPLAWNMFFTLMLLFAYVAIVEQRPPVLRAAIMVAIVVCGRFFYRRLDLLNSAAIAALLLLVANPIAIRDSSFQLTFVAIACIAGVAVPWLEQSTQPYAKALRGWRDVTRDAAHEPKQAQFRIDLRSVARWLAARLPLRLGRSVDFTLTSSLRFSLRLWELFVLTIVLQIGMLPLMAKDFHRITLSAPLANLAAVPITGVIVPLGFLTLAAGLLFPAAGKLLAAPLAWLTTLLFNLVHWFARFPRMSYRIPGPPIWLTASSFTAVALLVVALRLDSIRRHWIWTLSGLLFACSAMIAIFPFAPQWTPGTLEVTILDVGQGDSLLLVFPRGKTMLIDGGGAFAGFPSQQIQFSSDPGEEAVSPYLWSRGFKELGVVALTHAHQDHIGGLNAILQNFPVGELWIGREATSASLERLEALAREKHIRIVHEARGSQFSWGGVDGEFLWPEQPGNGQLTAPENNDSLVLRMKYGNEAVMLPGDAEKRAESEILSENNAGNLQSHLLKIGHHGSKNSTSPDFLAAVQPRVAVISAGEDNPYGHPNAELLERLERANVRILRTDRDGAVHFKTDGRQIEVTCFVRCGAATTNGTASGQSKSPDH